MTDSASPTLPAAEASVLAELAKLVHESGRLQAGTSLPITAGTWSDYGAYRLSGNVAAHVAETRIRALTIRSSGLTRLPDSLGRLALLLLPASTQEEESRARLRA